MSGQETSLEASPPKRYRSGRRILVCTIVLLLLVASLLLFGRATLAWSTRLMARARFNEGAISAAQGWLAWSAWFDPDNGATDVIRAACFRRLHQQDRWSAALKLAEQKGAPASQVQQETKLGRLQDGNLDKGVEGELAAMTEVGAPHDLYAALVAGCLVKGDPNRAKLVLDAWETRHPEEALFAFTQGSYWFWMSNVERNIERRWDFVDRSQLAFEKALAKQPHNELARVALANLFEDQSRLEEAFHHYAALLADSPASETARLKLAKLLRKLHRLDEARMMLESLPRQPQVSRELAGELAELEFESGNYQEADRWFALAIVDDPERSESVGPAACSSSVQEQASRAQQFFKRIDAIQNYNMRMEDLVARLTSGSDDPQTEDALRRLDASRPGNRERDAGPAAGDRQQGSEATAAGLYTQHCSGCHGENGDGRGHAARHLFPKPRDLRTGRSRLVSTLNGVPSLEDLEAVIRRGMPGTSMRAFDKLSEDHRMLLAQVVRRLNRLGIGERFIDTLVKEGENVDEDEVREVVKHGTTPADAARVPPIGPTDAQAIVRGKGTYGKLGCKNCHGDDGAGAWDLPLFDEQDRLSPPRDLVHNAFKGGPEPELLYLRLLLGMPGTPHPGCPGIADDERIDLVHFCRSLSQEPKRTLSNHQRALQAWTLQHR